MPAKIVLPIQYQKEHFIRWMKMLEINVNDNNESMEISSEPKQFLNLVEIYGADRKLQHFECIPLEQLNITRRALKAKTAEIIERYKTEKSKKDMPIEQFILLMKLAILYCPDDKLYDLFSDFIIPEINKKLPSCKVYLLKIDELLLKREKIFNLFISTKYLPEFHQNKNIEEFPGFKSLRALQGFLSAQVIDAYISFILLLFEPLSYGIHIERMNCLSFFIILFDKPLPYAFNYQQSFAEHYEPKEFYQTDMNDRNPLYTIYDNSNWSQEQFAMLFFDYIKKINSHFNFMYDPSNFTNSDGAVDWIKAFKVQYTLNRVIAESCIIHTQFANSLIRVPYTFAILDKVSNLIDELYPKNVEHFETKIFKTFFDRTIMMDIDYIYKQYPDPFCNHFKNKIKRLYNELYKNIRKSIYMKQRISGEEIIIDLNNRKKDMNIAKYTKDLIRALRNTHHGYSIDEDSLKKLAISDCAIGKSIEFLGPLIILLILADNQRFFKYISKITT